MENVKKMINSLYYKISRTFHSLKKNIHLKINTNSVLEHIIVLELYTLLTILAFHKLFILGVDKVLIGDGGDGYQFLWNFWWIKKAILEGRDVFYTDYLFHPKGTYLYAHTLTLTYSLIAFLLQNFTSNLILIYNILILASVIVASYSVFFLVKYITKNLLLSFLGGIYFGFSNYMYAKIIGQLNLTAIFVFPILIFLLLKLLERKEKILKLFYLMFSLFIFYVFVFFTDLYYFSFTLIITFIFLLFFLIKKHDILSFMVILATLIFVLISLSKLIFIMFEFSSKRCESCIIELKDVLHLPSLINYLSFSPFSLFGKYNYYLNLNPSYHLKPGNLFSYADSIISLPWSLTFPLLIVTSLLMFKRVYFSKREKELLFLFFLVSIIFFVLSSGPEILHRENLVFEIYHKISPYIRVSTRFSIVVLLSLIIIFMILLNKLIKKDRKFTLFIPLLMVASYVETFPQNFFFITFDLPPPSVIYTIKSDKENITILNIPPEWANSFSMYFQTIHEKKILDGYISRRDTESIYSLVMLKEFIRNKDVEGLLKFLKEQNTRYIIHYKFLRGEAFATTFEEIIKIVPPEIKEVIWEDNYYIIIKLRI
jgi:hypothetical protein